MPGLSNATNRIAARTAAAIHILAEVYMGFNKNLWHGGDCVGTHCQRLAFLSYLETSMQCRRGYFVFLGAPFPEPALLPESGLAAAVPVATGVAAAAGVEAAVAGDGPPLSLVKISSRFMPTPKR